MDDGWLLFDGVFLRLPIFLRAGVLLVCSAAALCNLWLCCAGSDCKFNRYVAALYRWLHCCAEYCCLAFSRCYWPRRAVPSLQPCAARRERSSGVYTAQRGCFGRIRFFLLASVLQAASPRAWRPSQSIGLSTAQRRNGAPLTPSPRRLDVVAKAINAAVRPHKLEGLPESMLSRADVSYSGSHHAHNSAHHA